MNVVKKIIAVITTVLITVRLAVISVSASFAAPFIAEESLKLLFIEALGATGSYSADDLEAWEYDDLKNEFEIQMTTNPNFNAKKVLPVFFDINDPGLGYNEDAAAFDKMANQAVSEWLNYMQSKGEELYDFINPTYAGPDLQGKTSVLFNYWAKDDKRYYDVYYSSQPGELYRHSDGVYYFIKYDYVEHYSPDGVRQGGPSTVTGGLSAKYVRCGEWVWREDGTQAPTDDETIPVIGEADGTQVTPDMLNPDGTVTIDGTTYYPKDFIDWDKFKDPAIIDLLNKILSKLEEVPVVSEQDKPLVDVDSIEIAVSEELSDYTVPVGISNVFPFCLPFDFARGVKMLLAKPEVPVFKTEFDLTDFCGFDLGVIPLEISLEKWEPAVVIIRWFFLFLFIVSLIKISPKIVKGAG